MEFDQRRQVTNMDRVNQEHPPYRQVKAAFPLYPCYILIEFDHGEYRVSDLSDYLKRPSELFQPLTRWESFRQLRVEDDTVVFPNGLDLDPAVLYAESKVFDVREIMQ